MARKKSSKPKQVEARATRRRHPGAAAGGVEQGARKGVRPCGSDPRAQRPSEHRRQICDVGAWGQRMASPAAQLPGWRVFGMIAGPVDPGLSLTAGCGGFDVSCLSPGGVRFFILRRSFAATGRGWRHPKSTCKRPASWMEGRWPEIQGARCVGLWRASAMAWDPGAQGAEPMTGVGPADSIARRQLAAGGKSPATRVPEGSLVWGGQPPRYRLPSRHPRTRRTSPAVACGAGGVGRWANSE